MTKQRPHITTDTPGNDMTEAEYQAQTDAFNAAALIVELYKGNHWQSQEVANVLARHVDQEALPQMLQELQGLAQRPDVSLRADRIAEKKAAAGEGQSSWAGRTSGDRTGRKIE